MTLEKCTAANPWKPNIDILPSSNFPGPLNLYLDPDGIMDNSDLSLRKAAMEGEIPIDYPQEFEESGHNEDSGRNIYAQARKHEFVGDMPPHHISTEYCTSLMGSQEQLVGRSTDTSGEGKEQQCQ